MDGRSPCRVRGAALVATLALHGLLLAAPWRPAHEPIPAPLVREPAPLLVTLLAEPAALGATPLVVPVPDDGARRAPRPPPPPPPEELPVAPALAPDRPALAVTAPNLGPLAAFRAPSAPIRLRLHIDASGRVDEVEVLDVAPDDIAFVERLAEILRATPHIPARRGGQDVASTKEIRLDFSGRA